MKSSKEARVDAALSKGAVFVHHVLNSDAPKANIICFPHAGGDPSFFSGWSFGDDFEANIFVVKFQSGAYSLAEGRFDFSKLRADISNVLLPILSSGPCFFFGHSFGSLLGFEVCCDLERRGLPTPILNIVSARRSPSIGLSEFGSGEPLHSLNDAAFKDAILAWGLIPENALDDEKYYQFVAKPLRDDLWVDHQYEYDGQTHSKTPLLVLGGSDDMTVSLQSLEAWKHMVHDSASVEFEMFSGNHFYMLGKGANFFGVLRDRLDVELSKLPPSVISSPDMAFDQTPVWCRFCQNVLAHPDRIALEDSQRSWTYLQLAQRVLRIAGKIQNAGLTSPSTVGILFPHSLEYIACQFAILSLKHTVCLSDAKWTPSLQAEFFESSQTVLVLTNTALSQRLGTVEGGGFAHLRLDSDWEHGSMLSKDDTLEKLRADLSDEHFNGAETAMVTMTSGSTGKPKAVLTTHIGMIYCFEAREIQYPYCEDGTDGLNIFFAWECMRPLLYGRRGVVIPDEIITDIPALARYLEEKQITRIVITPSLFESFIDHPILEGKTQAAFGDLKEVFLMGEVVTQSLARKAEQLCPDNLKLMNAYSTWESLDVSFLDILPFRDRISSILTVVPVGRVLESSAAVILDDKGALCPMGVPGMLYFTSPGLSTGYLADDQKTKDRFTKLPDAVAKSLADDRIYYFTGDRARIVGGDSLLILGRNDGTVKIRGFKVSVRSVEIALSENSRVKRAVVLPGLDETTGQTNFLTAYVTGRNGQPTNRELDKIKAEIKTVLPSYAVPQYIIGLKSFPMKEGQSRKLDISKLPVPEVTSAKTNAENEPRSPLEKIIGAVWKDLLSLPDVALQDNFFDMGGSSLSASMMVGILQKDYGIALSVMDVFQHATLGALVKHCKNASQSKKLARKANPQKPKASGKIAIIGMAGRFPGANSIDALWENLTKGIDSSITFSKQQLLEKGMPESTVSDPSWVPRGQVLDDADAFDAKFWGIGRREAQLMDPQHRIFIETAWAAMEQAGYARADNPYRERTGVFASCGIDGYLIHHLEGGELRSGLDPAGIFLTEIGNEKDYIAPRVSYLLDLGGPSVSVTSACSSALIAVTHAAQSIMTGQCNMAIAGASALTFPNFGYSYQEGLVSSIDGAVRPFDQDASGTVFGDSVGAIVLKNLEDAERDGDFIWAVLSGVGSSNDGKMKSGFSAPSAASQTRCIEDAIEMADIAPNQISYVECHATATNIGDAIELQGLHDAFKAMQQKKSFSPRSCAIGSIKGNIGHANAAAGITGIIKTAMALKKAELVPTAHFSKLSDKLLDFVDTEGSPFYVNEGHCPWDVDDPDTQLPRRAGVSSFGIGGTNAHVILEESSCTPPSYEDAGYVRPKHIITVSAKTPSALGANLKNLAAHLETNHDLSMPSVCKTLHRSREHHRFRSFVVTGTNMDDAVSRLQEDQRVTSAKDGITVAFMFSGQGSQHAAMACDLYDSNVDGGLFRKEFDTVCDIVSSYLEDDIRKKLLFATRDTIQDPVLTQCGLFAVEYALAQSLMNLGVEPVAMAGHSVGEYTAAVIAQAITLDEAARLVCTRSKATRNLCGANSPLGGMISVVGDTEEIRAWVTAHENIWVAAENAPGQLVLSVAQAHLDTYTAELTAQGYACRRVPVSHPFHSPLMAPVADAIEACSSDISIEQPRIPMVSNLTGSWFAGRNEPESYWSDHLLQPVQWRQNIATLMKWSPDILMEIGPGRTLTSFAAKCMAEADGERARLLTSLPGFGSEVSVDQSWCEMLGNLWSHGVDIDWEQYHHNEVTEDMTPLKHCLLPTYEFEKTRYWSKSEASIYVPSDPVATPTDVALTPSESVARRTSNAADLLVSFDQKTAPMAYLFCFVYAGGSARYFEELSRIAPTWLAVRAVELPGHLLRSEEALGTSDISDQILLNDINDAIRKEAADLPVFLCGMSFGVTLMSALVDGLVSDMDASGQLKGLIIAGRGRADEMNFHDPIENIGSFLMEAEDVTENELWREMFLPIIESDLKSDGRLAKRVKRMNGAFCMPIQVHCGLDDDSFNLTMAERWKQVSTSSEFNLHGYAGGHSFLIEEKSQIFLRIIEFVTRHIPLADINYIKAAPILESKWVPASLNSNQHDVNQWLSFSGDSWDTVAKQIVTSLGDQSTGKTIGLIAELGSDVAQEAFNVQQLLQRLERESSRGRLAIFLPCTPTGLAIAAMFLTFGAEQDLLEFLVIHYDGSFAQIDAMVQKKLSLPRSETDMSLRFSEGQFFEERLTTSDFAKPSSLPHSIETRTDDCYVVTGATGGLGRRLIKWLCDQGVEPKNIFAICRSSDVVFDAPVTIVVGQLADIENLDLSISKRSKIRGIFHLAGCLDDALLVNQTKAHLDKVLAPKLALQTLHDWADQRQVNWLVAYSSTSAILHTPGQSNYAAANSWMDGFTECLAGDHTTKMCCVNWGTWDEIGMSVGDKRAMDIAREKGETPLPFEAAMQSLAHVINYVEETQAQSFRYVICDIDWPNSAWSGATLARELVPTPIIVNDTHDTDAPLDRINAGAATETGVKAFLSRFLHEWDENVSLTDLGLDSLDFARIKGSFAKEFNIDISLQDIAQPQQTLKQLYHKMSDLHL